VSQTAQWARRNYGWGVDGAKRYGSRVIRRDEPPPRKALSADLYRGKLSVTRTIVPSTRALPCLGPNPANAANAYEPRLIILACFLDRNGWSGITLCANAVLP